MTTDQLLAITQSIPFLAGLHPKHFYPVGGGSINAAFRVDTQAGSFFLKLNTANKYPGMFEAEAAGLRLLESTRTVYVPSVLAAGAAGNNAFLLLEWINRGHVSGKFWENFGAGLASLHRCSSTTFGLSYDNYIGSLPQTNTFCNRWTDFFLDQRIQPQLQLARKNNLTDASLEKKFNAFFKSARQLFPEEQPALLHGDLWNGNFIAAEGSQPVLIDPAVYYGHREQDLAMTHLFGGFDNLFYDCYHAHYPLQPGFTQRIDFYNLYPLLVHLNLFGRSYLGEIKIILNPF